MSNATAALAGLHALEDEAMAVHKRVEQALDGCRQLLMGAIVQRYGKTYQITAVRAHRGIVKAYGARYYGKNSGRKRGVAVRSYDLGDFRQCKVLKNPDNGYAINSTAPQIIFPSFAQ